MARITYLTQVAGLEVEVRNQDEMTALFKKLGGHVVEHSDKSLVMEFPDQRSANEFRRAAEANGAMFD